MRFLLETLILTAVLAAPYFLLDYVWGKILGGVVALGYVAWAAVAKRRQHRGVPRPPVKVMLLVIGFQSAVPLMALGLMFAVVLGWLGWAYSIRIETVPAVVLGFLVLAPVLALALFPALARLGVEGGAATDFLTAVREKGFVYFRHSWLGATALTFALICLVLFAANLPPMQSLTTSMNVGDEPSMWELAMAFPFVPLGLVGGAGLLTVFRIFGIGGPSAGALTRAYAGDPGDIPAPTAGSSAIAGVAVLCGWCITVYLLLYFLHFDVVAAKSSMMH